MHFGFEIAQVALASLCVFTAFYESKDNHAEQLSNETLIARTAGSAGGLHLTLPAGSFVVEVRRRSQSVRL